MPGREEPPGAGEQGEVVGIAGDEEVVAVEAALVAEAVLDGDGVRVEPGGARPRSGRWRPMGSSSAQPPVRLQRHEQRAGEGLADRADLEQRVLVDRQGVAPRW